MRTLSFVHKHVRSILPVAFISFLACAYLTYRFFNQFREQLNIEFKASAMKGGEYENFLKAFANVVNQDSTRYKVKLKNINAPGASGSTIDQLDQGKADIGLVQSNAKWNSKNVSAVAYVYSELYFLVTNNHQVRSVKDIARSKDTLRIARLPAPSQTNRDLYNLLDFYAIDTSRLKFVDQDYAGTYHALKSKQVDIGFLIVGLGNKIISSILKDTSLNLINLENIDAYLLRRHKMNKFILPGGIFGLQRPDGDYTTVSTKAMLVVNSKLSDDIVYKITRALFEKESEIVNEYPFFQLQQINNEGETYIPVHPAVLQYYNRDQPAFLDKNSNLIATLLSLIGLILSGIPLYLEFAGRNKQTSTNVIAASG